MPVLWRRVVIFFAALMPLAWLIYSIQHALLGADPAKALVVFTGTWAFYFLLITLAVTPLRRLIHTKTLHFNWLGAHRRMLGLFCLFYACLHLLAFFVCILGLDASRFGNEILQRPYILVSLPAFLGLIILGATSTQAMMRRLGKRWVQWHKGIYAIALLAWIHVWMQVRASYFDALVLGALLCVLMAPRVYGWGIKAWAGWRLG